VPERELSGTFKGTSLADMREQIARMTKHESLALEVHCRNLLKASVAELGLDAARRETIIQIARTIANLDGCESIEAQHISEAINYRMLSS
jgi:predicted ATPase with chaperone activity